jgi:hypothetical protein
MIIRRLRRYNLTKIIEPGKEYSLAQFNMVWTSDLKHQESTLHYIGANNKKEVRSPLAAEAESI